jgi:hypothetical protein
MDSDMKPLALIVTALISFPAHAYDRSLAEKNRFKAAHPCPSTGKRAGPCPGYIVDHIIPLCGGGPDRPSNMQWQTVAEARLKDLREVAWCKCMDKHPRNQCYFKEANEK